MGRIKDLTGMKFGRLTVIGFSHMKNGSYWHCVCECGEKRIVQGVNLRIGKTKSCGCSLKDRQKLAAIGAKIANTKHGESKSRLYDIRIGMIQRCCNSNNPEYKYYGGRGITICNEWIESYEAFRKWALENGYTDNLSIDRIDSNGNYEPSNCRWADTKTQSMNKRNTRNVTINGETKHLKEWAKIYGIAITTLYTRMKNGMDEITAITSQKRR